MVINIAKTIFLFSYVASIILSIIYSFKEPNTESLSSDEEKTTKLEKTISVIVGIITVSFVILGSIYIIFKHKEFLWLYFIFFTIPFFLSQTAGTYLSIGIVRNVVQNEKKDKLSKRDVWALQTIAYALFFLDMLKVPTKLMKLIKSIENVIFSDFFYIVVYLLLLFLYIFLTCALLSQPLMFLSKIIIKLNTFIGEKTKLFSIGDFFIKRIDKNNIKQPLLVKIITKYQNMILRAIVWFFSPLLILLDVCLTLFRAMGSLLIQSIGYVFILLRMIKRTVGKIMTWINNLSDSHLVATSFRFALIATLTLTVITNRYSPILREYEKSTGVLEFVSSAILIPVIFEWIASARNIRTTNKED